MRIGKLAQRAGVHVQTVRYYERLKLLPAPERSLSGYRTYGTADLERVKFIRGTQELGFSLNEIRRLAAAHSAVLRCSATQQGSAAEMRLIVEMFEQKKAEVAGKIAQLRDLETKLHSGIEQLLRPVPLCPAGTAKPPHETCPHGQTPKS
jgi:MerR family mercuric resistance operon transcriptional regulator